MRYFKLIGAACLLFVFSCNKKENPKPDNTTNIPAYSHIQLKFNNVVDGQPIALGTMGYTNASGNRYSVDLLKYYVSSISLYNKNGLVKNCKNYTLINANDTTTCYFLIDTVMNDTYTSMSFCLGVDSSRNHTGLQEGDLDPSFGMVWDWNTGYMFLKHEGRFIDDSGKEKILLYHYGTDVAFTTINLPLSGLTVAGAPKRININFNLNNLYKAPNKIDFINNNNRQSLAFEDVPWIRMLKANFNNCFTIEKIEQ